MADTFFGFDTNLEPSLEHALHDEMTELGLEEEEEEYDALNSETFGEDALEGDWEEDHEKYAELSAQAKGRRVVPEPDGNKNGHLLPGKPSRSSETEEDLLHLEADHILEDRLSKLVCDENEDPAVLSSSLKHRDQVEGSGFPLLPDLKDRTYSSSAPSGSSIWSVFEDPPLQDPSILGLSKERLPKLEPPGLGRHFLNMGSMKTVEEVERDLLSSSQDRLAASSSSPSTFPFGSMDKLALKPSSVISVEDLERELTSSAAPGAFRTASRMVAPTSLVGGKGVSTQSGSTVNSAVASPFLVFSSAARFPSSQRAPGAGLNKCLPHADFRRMAPPPQLMPSQLLAAQNQRHLGNLLGYVPRLHLDRKVGLSYANLYEDRPLFAGSNDHRALLQQQQQKEPHPHPLGPHPHPPLHPQRNYPPPPLPPHLLRGGRGGGGGSFVNSYHHHHHNYNNNVQGYHQYYPRQGWGREEEDYDEYAGLMTNKEKQKLMHIQLMQLHSDKPYVEDYYYMVFKSRQRHEKNDDSCKDDMRRMLPEGMRIESRNYTPTQFENSLGKLQVVSVTAPRKIMDLGVVSLESSENLTQPQKEGRKFKQLLLEIEKLYTVLLALDEVKRKAETAVEGEVIDKDVLRLEEEQFLQRLGNAVTNEDKLASYLCVRKGKSLLARLLPLLPLHKQQPVLSAVLHNMSFVGKRDASDQVLPRMYPSLRSCVLQSSFPMLLYWARCLDGSWDNDASAASVAPGKATTTATHKSNLPAVFINKVGLSILLTMFTRAERLYDLTNDSTRESWSSFVRTVVEALENLPAKATMAETFQTFPEAEAHLERLQVNSQRFRTFALGREKGEK